MKNLIIGLCIAVGFIAGCNNDSSTSSEIERYDLIGTEANTKDKEQVKEVEIDLTELPQEILDTLESLYPGSDMIEAEKMQLKGDVSLYEIELRVEGIEVDVVFDETGKFIGEEDDDGDNDEGDDDDDDEGDDDDVNLSDLPEAVVETIAALYQGAVLLEAEKITGDNDEVKYEVEIKRDGKKIDIILDAEGNFLAEEIDW